MYIYLTAGTVDYLKQIEDKYTNETMITMVNFNGGLLLHETEGVSVFKEPRKYEAIHSTGTIKKEGYVVFHNIAVTEEGRPLFEHKITRVQSEITKQKSIIAIRVLRPLTSNTYIILTIWESETEYLNVRSTLELQINKGSEAGLDQQPKIFASASYVSTYTIIDNNESDKEQ